MNDIFSERSKKRGLFVAILAIVWTAIIAFSYFRNSSEINKNVSELALTEARHNFTKDVVYRKWAAKEGGLYVEVSDYTKPNPYLDVPDRDIETKDGKKLTLVNPAYMTRLVHEFEAEGKGIKGHLTSLNPINPQNKADEWETSALKSFRKGVKEHYSLEKHDSGYVFRYMTPFILDESCMKCHAKQGYKIGDIRGGISVSVPYEKYMSSADMHNRKELTFHLAMLFLGFFGLVFYYRRSSKYERSIEQHTRNLETRNRELELYRNNLELLVKERTDELKVQNIFLRTLIDTIPHPVFVKNSKGGFTEINKAFEEHYRLNRNEIIGKTLNEISNSALIEKIYEIENNLLKNPGLITYEQEIPWNDGGLRFFKIYETTYGEIENQPEGIVGLSIDITDQKDLQIRTDEALKQEKELNEMKTNFISMVSHEFRTPLTSVLTSTDLLEMYGRTWPEDKYMQYVNSIQNSVFDMVELLNDVLTISRAERGRITLDPVEIELKKNITELVEREKQNCKNSHSVKINFDESVSNAKADPKLMNHILDNLLSNAIKFSKPGTNIYLDVSMDKEFVYFKVKDEGVGIPPEELENIFDPFFRAKNALKIPGTGLGLSVVKQYTEVHGGSISVNSKLGEGSEFSVKLKMQ